MKLEVKKLTTQLTLLALLLVHVPQLVNIWRGASRNTLRKFHKPTNSSALADGVLHGQGLDLDATNPRVVRATVVLAVAEVADPRLEGRAIVLVYNVAVCQDARLAGDAGPFARVVEEAEVDVWVRS